MCASLCVHVRAGVCVCVCDCVCVCVCISIKESNHTDSRVDSLEK